MLVRVHDAIQTMYDRRRYLTALVRSGTSGPGSPRGADACRLLVVCQAPGYARLATSQREAKEAMPEFRATISVAGGSQDDRRGVINAIKAHALMGRANATRVDFLVPAGDDATHRLVVRVRTEDQLTGAHVDAIEKVCRTANKSAASYKLSVRASLEEVEQSNLI